MAIGSTSVIELVVPAEPSLLADLWTLTKPEVNFLILIAAFTGFYLGYPGNLNGFPFGRLFNALFGTLLVASGTGALNQYLESRFDARMRRTCRRPVPAGRIRPLAAEWFGVALATGGAVYLLATVNALASLLAVLTLLSYLFVYTPLKRKTPLCTLAGAFPGAMPPLIGWAAAAGSIAGSNAWILYAVLFLWQFPHFMAIAWMYREDYARAGYLVLPANCQSRFATWQILLPSIALFLLSLAAVAANRGGIVQYFVTVILASGLSYYAARHASLKSRTTARALLKASIVYLPLEFLILILGKR